MKRPIIISVLAALHVVTGIFLVLAGVVILWLGQTGIVSSLWIASLAATTSSLSPIGSLLVFQLLQVVAILAIVFAAYEFILGYGLWTLRRWAWWLSIIGLIGSIVTNTVIFPNAVGLVLAGVWILYFIWRRNFFRIGFKLPKLTL